MGYQAGDNLSFYAFTYNAFGGLESPSAQSALCYRNGADDSANTPLTVTVPATGTVKVTGTLYASAEVGDTINIVLTATVGGVVQKRELAAFLIELPGSGLSAQGVRDAMKLAPTDGDPAAGSVDKHLDDLVPGSPVDLTISDD